MLFPFKLEPIQGTKSGVSQKIDEIKPYYASAILCSAYPPPLVPTFWALGILNWIRQKSYDEDKRS